MIYLLTKSFVVPIAWIRGLFGIDTIQSQHA